MDGRSLPRASDSADQIARTIYMAIRVLPALEKVIVEVVRLPVPDADGCNWVAKHSVLPPDLPPGTARVVFDIIANARRHFNLWDVH